MLLKLLEWRDFILDWWQFRRESSATRDFDAALARCAELGHEQTPVGVFGSPGRQCVKCGYWTQISHDEFRRLFGVTFKNAVHRTKQQEGR
jgi:hypothetical protein